MALDDAQRNSILSYLHPASTATPPRTVTGPMTVRLMTANGTATSNGTELATGGGYTAGGRGITSWSAASAGSQATSAAVSWSNMPATTIVGIELWSSDSTPVRTEFGSITSVTTASGDTLSFASGAISSALA